MIKNYWPMVRCDSDSKKERKNINKVTIIKLLIKNRDLGVTMVEKTCIYLIKSNNQKKSSR